MNFRHSLSTRWPVAVVVLLTAACLATAHAPALAETTAADKLTALDTSLNLIPEDAAFYSSMLRNREQIEAIANSRAWAKLQAMPVVQMLRQKLESEMGTPGGQAGQVKAALENPQVQELLALLGDMFSNDVFIYGDHDMVDSLRLMQEVATAMRYGPLMLAISGQMKHLDEDQVQAMLLMAVLAENVDRVKVPGMVLGFKVKNANRAVMHLGKLEAILGFALASQDPKLAEALTHAKVGDNDYLVLTLEGSMVPWDEVPLERLKNMELQPGSVDKLVEKLKSEKLVIAMGMRGDYLLVSIGSSTEPLAKLNQGGGLAGRSEMAPLAQFADRPLVSLNYASKDFMAAANGTERQIDDLLDFVEQILPSLELTAEQQARIRQDAQELGTTLKEKMSVVGAASQVGFLSDKGVETYGYDWTTRPWLDGSKPLGLMRHVGGTPLMAVVARGKVSIADYDLAVKWLKKAHGYFEQYGVPNMDSDDREEYEEVAKLVGPILGRFHETTRGKFLPALDGQVGLVVDARLMSKRFLDTMPATAKAMPMVEPAILLGVQDVDLMRDALTDYWNIIHESWNAAAELNPELGEMPLPEPKTVDTPEGELFVFTPPEECPVDKQITPNVGLAKDVCVFTMTQAHSERLMKAMPLDDGGVMGNGDRPLAVAAVFHWAQLLRAGRPWIGLAVDSVVEEQLGPDAPEEMVKGIHEQVDTVVDVLSVLRSITSESYFEDGVLVTHTLAEIHDLDN